MCTHPKWQPKYGTLHARVDVLSAASPSLGIEPAADNNVMKVTEKCLFIRPVSGSIYGGRSSMSWWATVVLPFIFVFFSIVEFFSYRHDTATNGYNAGAISHYMENWHYPAGITFVFFLCCIWIFIPWRTQLPIIFNRETRKVTCIIKEKWISQRYEHLEVYIKDITTIASGGAPINEGVLILAFPYAAQDKTFSNDQLRISISATKDADEAFFNRGIYGAAMILEYIRLFMHQGAGALPPSSAISNYKATSIRECFSMWSPFKIFQSKVWWKRLIAPFLFPLVAPTLWLITLGDLLYMALDRILPRKKWPQELIDACDGVWNGEE